MKKLLKKLLCQIILEKFLFLCSFFSFHRKRPLTFSQAARNQKKISNSFQEISKHMVFLPIRDAVHDTVREAFPVNTSWLSPGTPEG